MTKKRIKMQVTMDVTEAQALALQSMFKFWNCLGSMGSSRMVAFCVDGDGDFKPKCEFQFSEPIQELTPELESAAMIWDEKSVGRAEFGFDYDPIAWKINSRK